jgi:hypothetical protein
MMSQHAAAAGAGMAPSRLHTRNLARDFLLFACVVALWPWLFAAGTAIDLYKGRRP